jgi:hypothetical protein
MRRIDGLQSHLRVHRELRHLHPSARSSACSVALHQPTIHAGYQPPFCEASVGTTGWTTDSVSPEYPRRLMLIAQIELILRRLAAPKNSSRLSELSPGG